MDNENRNTVSFCELLESYQVSNKVSSVTSSTHHMLDLVPCDDASNLIDRVSVEEEFPISPVHKLTTFKLLLPISKVTKKIYFSNKVGFSGATFINDISKKFYDITGECAHNEMEIKSNCVTCQTDIYNQLIMIKYNNVSCF